MGRERALMRRRLIPRCPHESSWAFGSGFQPGKTGVKRSVPFLEFDRKQSAKELAKRESSLQLSRSRLFFKKPSL